MVERYSGHVVGCPFSPSRSRGLRGDRPAVTVLDCKQDRLRNLNHCVSA